MSFYAEFAADYVEITGDADSGTLDRFVWNSTTYTCIADGQDKSEELEAGGFMEGTTVVLHVPTAQLTAGQPKTDHVITFRSKEWRIDTIDDDPDGNGIQMTCKVRNT